MAKEHRYDDKEYDQVGKDDCNNRTKEGAKEDTRLTDEAAGRERST